jgi:hypothetical protein
MLAGRKQLGISRDGVFLTSLPPLLLFSHAASLRLNRAGGFGVPSE